MFYFLFKVGPDLCDPCDPAASTCDEPLECSATTYRCECPAGFVQIEDECCKYQLFWSFSVFSIFTN
jgi:hypothetical protein